MPRNTSAWPDLCISVVVCGLLTAALFAFDRFFGAGAVVLCLCFAFFLRERHLKRERDLDAYFRDGDAGAMIDLVTGYVNERLDAYLETLFAVET